MTRQPSDCLVVLNCGFSSIKFAVFGADASPLPRSPMWNGKMQCLNGVFPELFEILLGASP